MQRAIKNGDTETGVTIMKMDKALDTGDMIYTVKTPITDIDTLESIHDRLADMSGEALLTVIDQLKNGTAVYEKQNSDKATYAEKILKNDEIIDFSRSAAEISCQIRGLTPIPYAHCRFNGKMIKILEARVESADVSGKRIGEV